VPALSWIGEGIALALSEECQVPGVDTISWEERSRFIEASDLPPNVPLSRASMIRIAQRIGADFMVFGQYSGTEDGLRIELRVLDVRHFKVGGPVVANGPAAALPQLENELAWILLSGGGRNGAVTREAFRARTRVIPNAAYAGFIDCLAVSDEGERTRLLLKSIESHRDFPQASFQLGARYFQAGDCGKAIQYLKPALREMQDYVETQFMLGTCFLRQDNLGEAIQAYNAVAARSPALEVFNNLGVAYLRRGDLPLAIQNLLQAHELARNDLTVGLNLAILRQFQGDQPAALAVLEELIKSHPEQGMLHYLSGVLLDSGGASERAAAAIDQAQKLGINPETMKRQDPRSWTRIFPSWLRRTAVPAIAVRKQE